MLHVVVEPDDVRVVELGEELRLRQETITSNHVALSGPGEHLDRDLAAEPTVARREDQAERATPEFGTQRVAG
ncbi:hypothetical protein GCM10020369_22160 [Cryptosporangium minutisporangium]|uniref:Uncharacterized protein n=1 Tax=Cryptosporangium minutisporangium TaxID=113569 RepID=A0ABP6SVQ5_9ACTN